MNVSKLIDLALKQLGVLAAGENASANEVADAVDSLHGLLAQWATDRLFIYKVQNITVNLTGKGRYTLNQAIDAVSDQAKLDGNDIVLVRDLNNTGVYTPVIYQVDTPYWHFDVLENAKTLELKAFTLPSSLDAQDELEIPDKYKRPLILTLALEIAPMFGVEASVLLLTNQARAIESLKRSNSTPFWSDNDLPVGVRCGYY